VFRNDLQVEITELGRELDFDNLSRGERNRLILGLSFASVMFGNLCIVRSILCLLTN